MPTTDEISDAVIALEKTSIESHMLDDIVHELKSTEAAEINNNGIEAQAKYILESGYRIDTFIRNFLKERI